jgi:hypothetical protein
MGKYPRQIGHAARNPSRTTGSKPAAALSTEFSIYFGPRDGAGFYTALGPLSMRQTAMGTTANDIGKTVHGLRAKSISVF